MEFLFDVFVVEAPRSALGDCGDDVWVDVLVLATFVVAIFVLAFVLAFVLVVAWLPELRAWELDKFVFRVLFVLAGA